MARTVEHLAAAREEYRDISEPITEHRCLRCHATGAGEAGATFADGFDRQEGVGCEACHGPGSGYAELEVMQDRERFLSRGGRIPDELTCRGCHTDEGFDFEERWPKIAHPVPEEASLPAGA